MDFQIDNQTKRDLGLLPEVRNEPSVFACFDLTTTKGGRAALLQLFSSLSNDAVLLTNRMDATRFIRDHTFDLAFDYLDLDFIEHYMAHETPIRRDNFIDALIDKLRNVISPQMIITLLSVG